MKKKMPKDKMRYKHKIKKQQAEKSRSVSTPAEETIVIEEKEEDVEIGDVYRIDGEKNDRVYRRI